MKKILIEVSGYDSSTAQYMKNKILEILYSLSGIIDETGSGLNVHIEEVEE